MEKIKNLALEDLERDILKQLDLLAETKEFELLEHKRREA